MSSTGEWENTREETDGEEEEEEDDGQYEHLSQGPLLPRQPQRLPVHLRTQSRMMCNKAGAAAYLNHLHSRTSTLNELKQVQAFLDS